MKQFHFSLDTVLDYKEQVLEEQKAVHAQAMSRVRRQEDALHRLRAKYQQYARDYQGRQASGMTAAEALLGAQGLRTLEAEMGQALDQLTQLRRQEEDQRGQVIAAQQETSSIQRLRTHKLDDYKKELTKSEERWIDEIISSARIRATG